MKPMLKQTLKIIVVLFISFCCINTNSLAVDFEPLWPLKESSFFVINGLDKYNGGGPHNGIDIDPSGISGQHVYPVATGEVVSVCKSYTGPVMDGSWGNYVMIKHIIDGQEYRSVYAHLEYGSISVSYGTKIEEDDLDNPIGKMGNTGNSGGEHLHLAIYKGAQHTFDLASYTFDYYMDNSNLTEELVFSERIVQNKSRYADWIQERCNYNEGNYYYEGNFNRYIKNCKPTYPCYATIKITEAAPIRSLPCNENTAKKLGLTSDEHFVVRNAKVGEYYTAIKILHNTEGNYWYEVKWRDSEGEKTGYIYSARTAEVTPLWNDVWIDDATKPSQFVVSDGKSYFDGKNCFGIAGTVKTEYTEPDYIWAEIKDANGTVVVSSQDNCYLGYSLSGKINNELVFGNLPAGNYTYEVRVQLKSYIVENNVVKDARTYTATALRWSFSGVDPNPVKYTVYLNGGSLNPVCYTKEVYGGSAVGSLPTVEIAGYNFDGWYTDPTAGEKVTEKYVIYKNTNLYARYEAKWYKIFLSEFSEYINLSYGSSFADLPTPSKDGYTFEGWYTDPEGGLKVTADTYLRYAVGTYARTARSAVASELMPEEGSLRITLYPHWSIVTGSGVCGDNLYWEIDEDGVLTITGSGKMYDYPQATDVPWNVNRAAITEIVLPSGMTSICDNAFSDMENVRSVEVPYTVESIGDSAFEGCSKMTSASIYSKKLSIKLHTVFENCSSSFTLYMPEDARWSTGNYKEGIVTCSHEYEMDFVAPTCVDDGYDRYICAMCGDEYHENYVDATGEHFYVYNADGNRIVETCINGCDHEEYATVTTEADWYFFVGEEVEPAEVYYTEDWVGEEAELFYENNAVAGIATASIWVADVTAFTNFTLVEPQVLVEGYCGDNLVWSIREDGVLFIECDGEMPDENPWEDWLDESGVKIRVREVVVSGDVTKIGAHAFSNMSWVESISLPDTIETIGDSAFWSCFNLKEIDLPEGLLHIGAKAFYNCYNLQEIELPESLVSIGGNAFDGCDEITSIALGANVSNISTDYWSGNALNNYYLEEIIVDSANPYYTSEDGVLYNAGQTVLIKYPTAKRGSVFEVPFSVKSIAADAFYKSRWLEKVYIPYSVTSISYSAFGDTNIESIWFYGDATSISSRSVYSTYATDLVIYYVESNTTWPTEELDDFSQRAFVCTHESIADRAIEETCISPGYYGSACQYCGELLEIYEETPASGVHELAYSANYYTITEQCVNCDHTATARLVLELKYYTYTGSPIMPATVKYSENWLGGELAIAYAQNIEVGQATAEIEIGDAMVQDVFYIEAEENFDHGICGDNLTWILTPDNILTIRGTGPMYDYGDDSYIPDAPFWLQEDTEYYPETVIIEEGVTSIGAYAFYQNGVVSTISLPDSLAAIGEYAFYSCTGLKEVDLPENLVEVGKSAFYNCIALTSAELPDSWTTIPDKMFGGCKNLTTITLPENLYQIGEYAFWATGLTSVDLPVNLGKIEALAFASTPMDRVILPPTVELETGTFYNSVTEVYVCSDMPTAISEEAFMFSADENNKAVTVYCADPEADWFKQDWELIEVELWQPEDHVNAERLVAPTCEKGYTFHYCECCGNGYKTDFIDSVEEHDLSYYAVGDAVIETCDNGCGHKEIARVSVAEYYHTHTGEEIAPAVIVYSEDWQGGTVRIEYRNNISAGIANALAIYQTARAETQFLITEAPVLGYGACGENLVWRFEENGTLTISGKGAMYDFSGITNGDIEFYPEWIDQGFEAAVKTVVVENGVTSIGDNAFAFCNCVRSVVLGADIESIGEYAFYETYMKSIPYLPKLTTIKEGAFAGAYNLQTMSVGKELKFVGEGAFGWCDRLSVFAYEGSEEEWCDVMIADNGRYHALSEHMWHSGGVR